MIMPTNKTAIINTTAPTLIPTQTPTARPSSVAVTALLITAAFNVPGTGAVVLSEVLAVAMCDVLSLFGPAPQFVDNTIAEYGLSEHNVTQRTFRVLHQIRIP